MGNRPFILPIQETKEVPGLTEWGNLKNKFSGKTLFRLKLYYLETGDLSVLDVINNRWFFEELFAYSRATRDINLLPALKKIAGSVRFDESLRQHASELVETFEELSLKKKSRPESTSYSEDFEKAENARQILAGSRYPQTTEVLRLLRDKSIELKRLGLFLIGKFKMTGMALEVCECLNTEGIEDDAFSVLLSLGNSAAKELDRYYLTSSGNINTAKTVLRLFTKIHHSEDMSFLVERLWTNSRQIKEMVLETLLASSYRVAGNEKERLIKTIFETFGTLAWIIAARISLLNNNNDILSLEMEKEYVRWKKYLLNLLTLMNDSTAITGEGGDLKDNKNDLIKSIPVLTGIVYDNTAATKPAGTEDTGDLKKKFKKLQKYFPCEIPAYISLLEDIINCDYNLISVWTKACTIRNIEQIEEENLGESVVALLFSPEEILRQEAARLIARSRRELYQATSGRIPENIRKHLDRIIAGETREKELVYEKARFLSACFKAANEDELLFLAGRMAFVCNDSTGIYSQPADTILWSFSEEKSDPQVFLNQEDITDPGKISRDIRSKCSFCYVLPLDVVRKFNFQYPERSFWIFEYIDKMEE